MADKKVESYRDLSGEKVEIFAHERSLNIDTEENYREAAQALYKELYSTKNSQSFILTSNKIASVHENMLTDGVVKKLRTRELFVSAFEDNKLISTRIYSTDVFEEILSEIECEIEKKMDAKSDTQLKELMVALAEYEYLEVIVM